MEQIVSIEFFEPKSLRDLFWRQAKVEVNNGLAGEMFLPALYVNSWKSDNDQVRLGRMTDWRDAGDEVYIGEGLRTFWMDGEDKAILEFNKIEFNPSES
jgi:type VI secretion system protein ImpE